MTKEQKKEAWVAAALLVIFIVLTWFWTAAY